MEASKSTELSPTVSTTTLPLTASTPAPASILPTRHLPTGPSILLTPTGSKFTETLHSPPALSSSSSSSSSSSFNPFDLPTCTKTRTNSTTLTITPLPRLRRCFRHRNPRVATAACDIANGQYRCDDGIAVYKGGCAAGTLAQLESGEIRLGDVFLRAKRDGLLKGRRSRAGEENIVDEVREGLERSDWRSLARVLMQVAGPLVDWKFATFYRGYGEDGLEDGRRESTRRACRSSPCFNPDMLLQDVQGVLDKIEWGTVVAMMETEMNRWRKWEEWGCEWLIVKSLEGAQVLRAVEKASRKCGVPEGQLRRAIEAYAFYTSSQENARKGGRKRGRLTADGLAQERKWERLAETLVEDLEYLWQDESYKNGARLMKRRMRRGVQECRKVYFDQCTMLLRGRYDWKLSPEYRRKMEEEGEAAAPPRRRESGTSKDGSLSATKRLSDTTTIVTDSLKRHTRELGVRVSELFRRSPNPPDQEAVEVEERSETEVSRPPCQEAQHYPIFDPNDPSHLPSHPMST